MTWDPLDPWTTITLSILGGVIAGVILLAGEVAFRKAYEGVQRRKAIMAIGQFFARWESTINDAMGFPGPESIGFISKESIQFARHKDFLRRAPNLIDRWSRYLTANQVEELSNYLEGHQTADIGILPHGTVLAQVQYEIFFSRARKFEWLEF